MHGISFLPLSTTSGSICSGPSDTSSHLPTTYWVLSSREDFYVDDIISNNKIVIKAEALRVFCSYCKWTSFWQCSASPRTQPASSTTAAPVSSQLVSIPKTSLGKRCFPECAELFLSHAARPCLTDCKTLLATLFIVYNLPGGYVYKRTA